MYPSENLRVFYFRFRGKSICTFCMIHPEKIKIIFFKKQKRKEKLEPGLNNFLDRDLLSLNNNKK